MKILRLSFQRKTHQQKLELIKFILIRLYLTKTVIFTYKVLYLGINSQVIAQIYSLYSLVSTVSLYVHEVKFPLRSVAMR